MEVKTETYNLNQEIETLRNDSLGPINKWGRNTKIWIGCLLIVIIWGLYCYIQQLRAGLGVTAMRNYVSWGLYISTFVFFIGISHSGTLVSAILRITKQEWRRPITRSAELLTFVSLLFGGIMPIIDLGRPDRILNLATYGRIQSPLMWDIVSICTYFVGSSVFLFLPMIPDMALCRDRLTICNTRFQKFRKWLYTFMALGWKGTKSQWHRLEKSMTIMTIIIIPVAVSVHTVVSYIFAMTLRPGWNSTVFGPYFVAGALYSGSAGVIIGMWVFRKLYNLEKYITRRHFDLMGRIVLALTLIYAYLNLNEYWIPAYKMATAEGHLLTDLFSGSYSTVFWILQFGTVLLPIIVLSFPKGRRPLMILITCIIIVAGAWAKRYVIVVPTLLHPFMPIQEVPGDWSSYFPNYIEFSITAACLAGIFLVITLFSKFFPMMAVWEVEEGIHIEHDKNVAIEIRTKREAEEALLIRNQIQKDIEPKIQPA
ncbi:MAG TPA: NrfD/PsrC family molybdoenzyme membrane anchor subunit [Chitinophagaceae bacterium]|nr:NrfD/PsrC family molybdoenzyme membrane anchor subunit [Chitinophagaceae bacterium]